ncbi:MAG: DUF421 domain-containing protein [Pedobacter sp.]|nr:DUF421 domain-containing protein [Pedobacter sp.]MDQ8052297.1 DUF421 domain-containing protein [Pedobacter sp.]
MDYIFGHGKDLNSLQMCCRGILVFVIALLLIRISGRRSFKMGAPLDNIISISLGALLSRAVVGVSPFVPVVAVCFVIVILHRLIGILMVHHQASSRMIEGDKILLFENGQFIAKRLHRALISEEDVMQGIRNAAQTEDLGLIDKVYMERNGEITVIKKKIEI